MSTTILIFLAVSVMVALPITTYAVEPLERVSVENSRLTNAFEAPVGTQISVNQRVQIVSYIQNQQDQNQQFIYIVQIKDSEQKVVSLDWLSGNLEPNQAFSSSLSWTPQLGGEYAAEIFVWDSFLDRLPLAQPSLIRITVS